MSGHDDGVCSKCRDTSGIVCDGACGKVSMVDHLDNASVEAAMVVSDETCR